ncbi:hypothetical protein [Massilia violaceinigra]|uniref:hypothetical protein n=1 Tax=Massilia violaceinigra TaxID=2045208 RepID=UPI0012FDE355|nr:hypothetical protein [Massilia violaceinigra]
MPDTHATHGPVPPAAANRALTEAEVGLVRHMLGNGNADAQQYLGQLDLLEVTPWRCGCGCSSIDFQVRGRPPAPAGVHILGDVVFGTGDDLAGIFIFSSQSMLSGIEVVGLTGAAPSFLPSPDMLRPWSDAAGTGTG